MIDHRYASGALIALLLAGCGRAPGSGYDPPYAIFHAAITAAHVPINGPEVRAALVWRRTTFEKDKPILVAQDVGVEAQFPVHFTLNVTELPPEAAMNSLAPDDSNATPGAMSVLVGCASANGTPEPCPPPPPPIPKGTKAAYGTIIIYEDSDNNGQLDLITSSSGNSPDRVLGTRSDIFIQYLEGTLPPEWNSLGIQPGYNLIQGGQLVGPKPGDSTCMLKDSPANRIDLGTEIDIELTQDPTLNRLLCDVEGPPSIAGGATTVCHGQQCPLPEAGDKVSCSADRRAFVAERDWNSGGVCGSYSTEYFCASLEQGAPAPAHWPCP